MAPRSDSSSSGIAVGAPSLEARDIVKRFPGVIALKGVSFDVRPGEVHALCGENGAGKSTLIKTLSGVHPAGSYEGDILVDGKVGSFRSTKDAQAAGVAVIYQELALVPEMTVAENVFLGNAPKKLGGVAIDWSQMIDRARRLLDQFGLDLDPLARVQGLGIGHRQLVEIAKALSKNARVIIFDEPTAALTEQEVAVLLDIIRDLRRRGIAIVYISHKLEEVFAIADRITVLRDGKSVVTFGTSSATRDDLIRHMVGREVSDLFPRRKTEAGDVLLSVRDLSVADAFGGRCLSGINFNVHAGEVLGIGGLMGAGRTELLMHLFGAFGERVGGEVHLNGQPLGPGNSPSQSVRRGLVLVSEDRKRYGLMLDRGLGFNFSLSWFCKFWRGLSILKPVDARQETQKNWQYFRSLRVKAPGLQTRVQTLSGGNQQKVVIGKALMTEPSVVLLDEPTRGIDVGAKLEVYDLINSLTEAGRAVVLVSGELPELMGMSDRIVMLAEGRVGGEFDRSGATQETLMAAAMRREPAGVH